MIIKRGEKKQSSSHMSILEDDIRISALYIWNNKRLKIGQWHTSQNLEMSLLICEALVCKFEVLTC